MTGRALALLAVVSGALVVLAGGGVTAGAAGGPAGRPEIKLSTQTIVPGQRLTVSVTGLPAGTALNASICGADATSGSADCAVTASADFFPGRTGTLVAVMTGAVPPQPCPCVVLIVGGTTGFEQTVPVTVAGAPSAPVRPLPRSVKTHLVLSGVEVRRATTLASSFGGAAPRTLELRITNRGTYPVTPELVGRWGKGPHLGYVITMPHLATLGAGRSREVRVPFDLRALSVGDYRVQVMVQVVGESTEFTASAPTSQWPVGLFAGGLVVLAVLVLWVALAIARAVRRRLWLKAGLRAVVTMRATPPYGTPATRPSDISTTPPEGTPVTRPVVVGEREPVPPAPAQGAPPGPLPEDPPEVPADEPEVPAAPATPPG